MHQSKSILCRKTVTREAILSCITEAHAPLAIDDIKRTLRKKHCSVDEATIYRTIKAFVANGILQQIDVQEGRFRYEMANLPHHHHLICEKCGSIESVFLREDSLLKQFRIKTKFKVTRHSLEFFGLCHTCQ